MCGGGYGQKFGKAFNDGDYVGLGCGHGLIKLNKVYKVNRVNKVYKVNRVNKVIK